MDEYTYKGKTIEEWEEEVKNAEGSDEEGHPKWWKAQAELENASTYVKLMEEASLAMKKE